MSRAYGQVVAAGAIILFALEGPVVAGKGEAGSILDHPTLNVIPDDAPSTRPGMYGGWVHDVDGKVPCTVYIGRRPTMEDGGAISFEVHLLETYGPAQRFLRSPRLCVAVAFFHRPDERFADVAALRVQQGRDRVEILARLHKGAD